MKADLHANVDALQARADEKNLCESNSPSRTFRVDLAFYTLQRLWWDIGSVQSQRAKTLIQHYIRTPTTQIFLRTVFHPCGSVGPVVRLAHGPGCKQ